MKKKSKARRASTPKPKATAKKKSARLMADAKSVAAKSKETQAEWHLLLYVAGMTPKSDGALRNLKALCDEHLKGKYFIEVIDLLEKPQLAKGDQILAIPTLVRKLPAPIKKMIGDLSNSERVLVGLNLKAIGF